MKAAIDIGSNTVLLLVGRVDGKKVQVIHEEQQAPRLGRGVDSQQNLHPDSMRRAIEALSTYRNVLDNDFKQVERVKLVATSAVRDANNRAEFIDAIKKQTGFKVHVLSGEEEAELTFEGAQSVLPETSEPIAVIDIGGGSTEVATGSNEGMDDRFSFDIGSVRFTERYLQSNPPTSSELKASRGAIQDALKERPFNLNSDVILIGVAGTVTSVAAIRLQLTEYRPDIINETTLTLQNVSDTISEFTKYTADDLLEKYPVFLKGRADVITGGLLILEGFMQYYGINELTASTGGIRHGALLNN